MLRYFEADPVCRLGAAFAPVAVQAEAGATKYPPIVADIVSLDIARVADVIHRPGGRVSDAPANHTLARDGQIRSWGWARRSPAVFQFRFQLGPGCGSRLTAVAPETSLGVWAKQQDSFFVF